MDQDLASRLRKFESLNLDGNHVVLDFLNTLDRRGTNREYDWLTDYLDLLAWTVRSGLTNAEEASLRTGIQDDAPEVAASAFSRAVDTRELLNRIIAAHTGTGSASDEDWQRFNELLRDVRTKCKLVPADSDACCRWAFDAARDDPLWFLVPLVMYTETLLTTPDEGRIKQCAAEGCGWYFFDTSRNNGRRWCSPQCGNRTKVMRHYYRHRKSL